MISAAPAATKYDVVTAVWGAEFINLYLDLCVANQLSPGNLPSLPAGSRYRIFTTKEDVPALESNPRLRAVRDVLPVDIVEVDMTEADRSARPQERWNTHKRMIACHRQAATDAAREERGLIYLAPDFVLAEGTVAGLLRVHRGGARAVMTMNLRLCREAFLAELSAHGGPAALPPRDLVRVAMRHLHPWARSLMVDATSTSATPTAVFWPVRSGGTLEGVLVQSLSLHPMLVDPVLRNRLPGGPIDSHYVRDCCPDVTECHVVDDSDELVVFELSPAGREIGRQVRRDGVSVLRLAAAAANCDGHQLSYWQHPIRLHAGPLDDRWASMGAASSRFASTFARCRTYGPVLDVIFEWQKSMRRRQDTYETALRKARRRYPQVVRRMRHHGERFARALRKAMRSPVTAKQAARPAKLLFHRAARTVKLRVKRIRRLHIWANSRTNL